jgi:hypothetical protein
MRDAIIRHYRANRILILNNRVAGIEVIKRNKHRIIYKIDREDISKIERYRWYDHNGYCSTLYDDGKEINLSQLIMGKPPEGHVAHHVNGEKTDYRKQNLRIVPWSVNNYFKRVQRNNTSSIRGIHIYKRGTIVANHGSKKFCCKSLQEAIEIRKIYDDQMQQYIQEKGNLQH